MDLEYIIQQSPANISDTEIEEIYIKNNKNKVDTLSELWSIEKIKDKELDDWGKRRQIFDEHDKECYKYLNLSNTKTKINN